MVERRQNLQVGVTLSFMNWVRSRGSILYWRNYKVSDVCVCWIAVNVWCVLD